MKPWNELSEADRTRLLRFIDSGGQDLGLSELDRAAQGPEGDRLRAAAEQFLRSLVRRYEGAIGREIETAVVGELLTALARVIEMAVAEAERDPFEPMHHHNEPGHPNADPFLAGHMMRMLEVNQSLFTRQASALAEENVALQRRVYEATKELEDMADRDRIRELAARNARFIVARDPLEQRTLTLPLRDATILPGEAEDIQVLPKTLFRIERLLISDECVGCMVEELRIGTQAILREVLPCSAAVFAQMPLPTGLADRVVSAPGRPRMTTSQVIQRARDVVAELLPKQDVALPGCAITLRVRNIGEQPVAFRGAFFGRAVR